MMVFGQNAVNPTGFGVERVKAGLKADNHEYQETDGDSRCQACYIDDRII